MDRISRDQARRLWAHAQSLDQPAQSTTALEEVVSRTGWIRTLGGAEAYLALSARRESVTVEATHVAVAERELVVSPAARGCIYLVPRRDAALALRIAERLSARRNARDLEKAGVEAEELHETCAAIVEVLASGPMATNVVRKRLPSSAWRSLGAAGKKVGISSTIPPALRQLEFAGTVVRRPVDNRLDHEKYLWSLADEGSESATEVDDETLAQELARRYFTWCGPATRRAFAAWSGLGQRDAKAAIAKVGLMPVEVEGLGEAFVTEGAYALRNELTEERERFLPALDNLFGFTSTPQMLVDDEHGDVRVSAFGRPAVAPIRSCGQPLDRTMSVGGRIVGLWAWDTAGEQVVARRFDGGVPDTREVARTQALLSALGHGKAFSLDSKESLDRRLTRILDQFDDETGG